MNPDPNSPVNPNENPSVSPANDATPSFSNPAPAPEVAPEVTPVTEPAPVQPGAPEPQVQPQANPFAAPQPQSPFGAAQPTAPLGGPIPSNNPTPSGRNKKLPIIIASVVALLLIACVTAWALTREDETDKKSDANTSVSQEDTDAADTPESKEEVPVATGAQAVNKKVEDAELGFSINIVSVQRNLDITPDKKYVALKDKAFVAVEVEADATNRKYTAGLSDGSFRLVDAAGKQITNSNSILESSIQQLGLQPLKATSAASLVEKGVVVFAVDPAQIGSLKLRYSRLAMSSIGGGAQIPALQIDTDL